MGYTSDGAVRGHLLPEGGVQGHLISEGEAEDSGLMGALAGGGAGAAAYHFGKDNKWVQGHPGMSRVAGIAAVIGGAVAGHLAQDAAFGGKKGKKEKKDKKQRSRSVGSSSSSSS